MNSIGQAIKSLRKSLGLSQEKFAELVRCHTLSVNRWETDKYPPSTSTMQLIAMRTGAEFVIVYRACGEVEYTWQIS